VGSDMGIRDRDMTRRNYHVNLIPYNDYDSRRKKRN